MNAHIGWPAVVRQAGEIAERRGHDMLIMLLLLLGALAIIAAVALSQLGKPDCRFQPVRCWCGAKDTAASPTSSALQCDHNLPGEIMFVATDHRRSMRFNGSMVGHPTVRMAANTPQSFG
jgi:hypothetical protein